MPKKENLLNQKFNRLTVIDEAPSINKKTFWKCKCDCGNILNVRADALKSGKTKSCGCLNNEMRSKIGKNNIKDITNKRFGKLVAIERTNIRQNDSLGYDWICKCDCGNIVSVPITYLNNGNTLSCGCIKESLGEQEISKLLIKNNIKFETQKTFDGLLSEKNKKLKFDFYLNNFNILIEFDGPQHYKKTNFTSINELKNDLIKNEWCLKNNIKLYRIPYTEINNLKTYNINNLLDDKFLVKTVRFYNDVLEEYNL